MFSTNYVQRVQRQVYKLTSAWNELIFYLANDDNNMVMMIHVQSELTAYHSDKYFS